MAIISTATVGRRSELIAISALLSNGYSVWEPAVPESADLAITKFGDNTMVRIQVKTLQYREDKGGPYYILKTLKNSGKVYTKEDCDVFIGVVGNEAYMVENDGKQGEYWCKPKDLDTKWTRLTTGLEHTQTNVNESA
jgi:hypothetical protein